MCALTVLLLCLSTLALVAIGLADNASFTVQPQKEHAITLNLKETDSISGSFSVVSNDDTGINFYINDQFNYTVLRQDNVKHRSFSLIINSTGDYTLHFDNSLSTSYSKTVALNYNVIHYIMGMPQEQFLFVVVAIVAVIGIVAYLALMPK